MLCYIPKIMLLPNISFYRIATPIRMKNDFLNTAFNISLFTFYYMITGLASSPSALNTLLYFLYFPVFL